MPGACYLPAFGAGFRTLGVGVPLAGGVEAGASTTGEGLAAGRRIEPNRSPQTGSSSSSGGDVESGVLLATLGPGRARGRRDGGGRTIPGHPTLSSLACAASISRRTPANNSVASTEVKPRLATSSRSPGLSILRTSVACSSPPAPIFTNLTIQAMHLRSRQKQTRKYSLGSYTPNSRQSPYTVGARPVRLYAKSTLNCRQAVAAIPFCFAPMGPGCHP